MPIKNFGAFGFGLIIGWYIYYINRYRKGDVQLGDITTLVGAIGGASVLALFPQGSDLFASYGIGLAIGFFGYFLTLVILVAISPNFDADWFLDGRRKDPAAPYSIPGSTAQTGRAMAVKPLPEALYAMNPGPTQQFFIGQSAPLSAPISAPTNSNAQRIIDTCKAVWPSKKNACNFFAIEVADKVGVALTGLADNLVDQIKGVDWSQLADGPAARDAAALGKFVIAGLKSKDFVTPRTEGHVAIVVVGPMNPGVWAPAGYWGSTDSSVAEGGGFGNPISVCFRKEDSAKIVYACRDL
jgi:hypothetical protein